MTVLESCCIIVVIIAISSPRVRIRVSVVDNVISDTVDKGRIPGPTRESCS